MSAKTQYYAQMAKEAAGQITGSYQRWTGFLTTAARLYKYPYDEQLMIYTQRPDATACAEYDLWNKTMRRYVKRGAKGIALLDYSGDYPKLRYVFDVSDTGARRNSRPVNLWQMREEHREPVQAALERTYGVTAEISLQDQLEQIAQQLAVEYWRDYGNRLLDIVAESYLEGYDEYNIGTAFRPAVVDAPDTDSGHVDAMLAEAQQIAAENQLAPPERFTVIETEDGYALWDDVREEIYVDEDGVSEEFDSEWQAEDYRQAVIKQIEAREAAEWLYAEQARQDVAPEQEEPVVSEDVSGAESGQMPDEVLPEIDGSIPASSSPDAGKTVDGVKLHSIVIDLTPTG